MASFSIGYHSLCERNIHHIYTTTTLKPAATRRILPYKPEFLAEEGRELKRKNYNMRFMEYVPQYQFILPRAAAFDAKTPQYVSTIVNRLHRERKPDFAARFQQPKTPDWDKSAEEKKERLKRVLQMFGRQRKAKTKNIAKLNQDKTTAERKVSKLPAIV